MKVVFATDDKKTISRMTGRAKWFAFYTIKNGKIEDIEYVENIHTHSDHSHNNGTRQEQQHTEEHDLHKNDGQGHNHHDGHSHKDIVGEIASRDALFITRHLGKHFKEGIIEFGIEYKMTKIETIEEALATL